jgi:hypothetical protein
MQHGRTRTMFFSKDGTLDHQRGVPACSANKFVTFGDMCKYIQESVVYASGKHLKGIIIPKLLITINNALLLLLLLPLSVHYLLFGS